jgi:hypothetical protein
MLRVRQSQPLSQNDDEGTRHEQQGNRMNGASAARQILLFAQDGLKSTNCLASDVQQLS